MAQEKDFICDCQTTGLAILPVRYAVVPKTVPQGLPTWADRGWAKSKGSKADLDPNQYHYALRVVRQGFIYLYLSGLEGNDKWRVFSIAKDGTLWRQPSALSARLKDKSDCSTSQHDAVRTEFFCISEPEKCGQIWIAYSEHKWSENTLNKYAAEPGMRMREIKPEEWKAPPNKNDIAVANEGNLNSVLDYCTEFDYVTFPDLDYGLPEPYSKVVTRDNKNAILASRDRQFRVTTGNSDNFSFIDAQVERVSSHHFFVKARRNNAVKTYEKMKECCAGGASPLLIALDDPIGITHDLNDFFNELAGKLTQYTNELSYYFNAWSLIGSLKNLMVNYDSMMDENKAQAEHEPEKTRRLNRAQLRKIWMKEPVEPEYFRLLDRVTYESPRGDNEAAYQRALADLTTSVNNQVAYSKSQGITEPKFILMDRWAKYEKRLNKGGLYNQFNQSYESLQTKIAQVGELRCKAIVTWLEDDLFELVLNDYDDSIDVSDPDLFADAVEFKEVIAAAINGINATKVGMALIDSWLDSSGSNKNYLRRVLALNQSSIIAEIDVIMDERNQPNSEYEPTEQEITAILSKVKWNKIADLYKKAQGYANTQLRLLGAVPDFGKVPASWRPLKYISEIILVQFGPRFLFASYGPISKAGELMLTKFLLVGSFISVASSDKVTTQVWSMRHSGRAAYIRRLKGIGKVADQNNKSEYAEIKKAFEELETNSKSSSSAIRVKDNASKIPARNGVIDVRLAFLVNAIEIWNLMSISEQVKNDPDNRALQEKLTIAKFAAVGTSIETLAQATKMVATDASPLFQVLKVSGAVVSSGAGVLNTCIDFRHFDEKWDKEYYAVASLYFIRSGLNFASSATGILTALTYSTPFMEIFIETKLAEVYINTFIKREVVGAAARIALFRAVAMGAGIYVSLIILAVSALIYLLDENEMEEWIDKSAFGTKRLEIYSDNIENQQYGFEKALRKILGIEEPKEENNDYKVHVPANAPGLTHF